MTIATRVSCVSVLFATVPAFADGDAAAARDILEKARDALKKVEFVTYEFDLEPTGGLKPRGGAASGTVTLGPPSEEEVHRFRCEIDVDDPSTFSRIRTTGGADGENYYLIDHVRKLVYEDLDPAVVGRQGRALQQYLVPIFAADEPFKAAIASEEIELRGEERIGEEECYKVYVKQKPHSMIWFISKRDYLPRGYKQVIVLKNETKEWGSRIFKITKLTVHDKLAEGELTVKVPNGYKKTDEYAP